MEDDLIRIWYVSAQRLCNFRCPYCVSVGDYSKSNEFDWKRDGDRTDFERIVAWIGSRPFPVGVRLATLGEPFASDDFLARAAWLTRQPDIRFIELLTNGSLLKRRLPRLADQADLGKVSLWMTRHDGEIDLRRFIDNARFARDEYGCFVVVNGLLFPDNADAIAELRAAAEDAGLRFNLDFGYNPDVSAPDGEPGSHRVPVLRTEGGLATALRLGANPDLVHVNLTALDHAYQQPCSAGHDYFYIGIGGDVFRCSRYQILRKKPLGNVLDPAFELDLRQARWSGCGARSGCCNKEDFLNLALAGDHRRAATPSLGWLGA